MKDVSGTVKGRVSFPETSWELLSLVSAKPSAPASRAAADRLASRYYEPVRAYISAIARNRDDQEDLTHRFFVSSVLSGRVFAAADRPGWRELGERFGVDEKTARARAETAARHFRGELRRLAPRRAVTRFMSRRLRGDLVAAELTSQGDADEER